MTASPKFCGALGFSGGAPSVLGGADGETAVDLQPHANRPAAFDVSNRRWFALRRPRQSSNGEGWHRRYRSVDYSASPRLCSVFCRTPMLPCLRAQARIWPIPDRFSESAEWSSGRVLQRGSPSNVKAISGVTQPVFRTFRGEGPPIPTTVFSSTIWSPAGGGIGGPVANCRCARFPDLKPM